MIILVIIYPDTHQVFPWEALTTVHLRVAPRDGSAVPAVPAYMVSWESMVVSWDFMVDLMVMGFTLW